MFHLQCINACIWYIQCEKKTCLYVAAEHGYAEIVDMLLARGAGVDKADKVCHLIILTFLLTIYLKFIFNLCASVYIAWTDSFVCCS